MLGAKVIANWIPERIEESRPRRARIPRSACEAAVVDLGQEDAARLTAVAAELQATVATQAQSTVNHVTATAAVRTGLARGHVIVKLLDAMPAERRKRIEKRFQKSLAAMLPTSAAHWPNMLKPWAVGWRSVRYSKRN